MFRNAFVFLSSVFLFCCASVSNPAEALAGDCPFPDAPEKEAPAWVCGESIEGFALTAVGFAEKKPSVSMTKTAATAQARAQMSAYFAADVSEIINEYQKSLTTEDKEKFIVDIDTVRQQVTSMTLYGTRVVRTLTSPTGGQYVVLAMDDFTYQKNSEKVFAALTDENAEMKQMFNNEQARERLMSMIKVK